MFVRDGDGTYNVDPCIVPGCTSDLTFPISITDNIHKSLCRLHIALWRASPTWKAVKLGPPISYGEIGGILLKWAKHVAPGIRLLRA